MTSEQQSAEGPRPSEQTPSAPKPHQRVPLLLGPARDDAEACKELIDALIAMREPGDEADEARVVIGSLEAKSLENLRDESGRDAKAEAVETLLSLGFPFALNVAPEDLAYLRDQKPRTLSDVVLRIQKSRARLVRFALVGQLLSVGAMLFTGKHDAMLALEVVLGIVTFGSSVWLDSLPPTTDNQALPVTVMILALIASAIVGLFGGPIALLGAVVTSLGLYSLLSWQKVD